MSDYDYPTKHVVDLRGLPVSYSQLKLEINGFDIETVFYDKSARLIFDPDHSEDEDRFILLGLSTELKLLIVVHVYKENDEIIRIISARKATKHEQAKYKR